MALQRSPNTTDFTIRAHRAPNQFPQVPAPIVDMLRPIVEQFPEPVSLNFWDNLRLTNQFGQSGTPLRITITHPGVLRHAILKGDPLFLVKAWLLNALQFDGELESMLEFAERVVWHKFTARQAARAWLAATQLPPLHLSGDAAATKHIRQRVEDQDALNIQHHYDVGDDFYKLFLDQQMVYSCAHFEEADMRLDEAQERKLDLICRKLMLKPGERLLDVGSGWGALLMHAVKHYGVSAHGITLSDRQFHYTQEQIAELGLSDHLSVSLLDYRQLQETAAYDKIVSVGMIEHVGLQNYHLYFSKLHEALKPGGLFLCHGITAQDASNSKNLQATFIDKYIFPGSQLSTLSDMVACAQRAGWEIADVDAWRPHYAKTLRSWVSNLQSNQAVATEIVGEQRVKLWLMFMLASARGFERNYLGINQILLRRADDREWNLPLTRSWLL